MRDKIEKVLARSWPYLLGGMLCLVLVSCAATHFAEDGTLVTTGEHLVPDLADTIGDAVGVPVEDVVGAAGDAVDGADVPEIVSDFVAGRWISGALGVIGVGLAVFYGVKRRRAARKVA